MLHIVAENLAICFSMKIINFKFFINILKNINFKRGAIVYSNEAIQEQSFKLLFSKKFDFPASIYFPCLFRSCTIQCRLYIHFTTPGTTWSHPLFNAIGKISHWFGLCLCCASIIMDQVYRNIFLKEKAGMVALRDFSLW